MDRPNYEGVVERWKSKLIVERARRMGFRPDEIPDLQQQMILDVMQFRFDVSKSNGASERTVLQSLIDNHLRKARRSYSRYRACMDRVERDALGACVLPQGDIVHDVRAAVMELTEREQLVCQALSMGYSKCEIAQGLGCGWHTVERIKSRVKKLLEDRGLAPSSRDR